MDKKLIKEIVKTRNAIRKKFQALKTGRMETETQLEETFKPITKPLGQLVSQIKHEHEIKAEPKMEYDSPLKYLKKEPEEASEVVIPPTKRKNLKTEQPSTSKRFRGYSSMSDDDDFATPTHSSTLRRATSMTDIPNNTPISEYMNLYVNQSTRIDRSFGVYHDGVNWKIGNSILQVDGDNVIVKGKKYTITPGLLELLFIKTPKKVYTKEDMDNYSTIISDTNAYKRDNEEGGQIKGNRSKKYTSIIKKLIFPEGRGLMQIPKKNIDYTYWDDPNELVDRLRLLMASQQAGNNSHNNEIVSIIEELQEANIIV